MSESNKMDLENLEVIKKQYSDKFGSEAKIFRNIHRGEHIFVHTGCGEPQYLINALTNYIVSNPKAFVDAEVFHVWSLGVAPYVNPKFKLNFRTNSFFVATPTREAVNTGLADYTPIFLSNVPNIFYRELVPIDIALIQCSLPDRHGYVSLGVSVDIVKAAVEKANLVIAQINSYMPRVHGDGFVHLEDIDFIIHHDEPILEFTADHYDLESYVEISTKIGKYASRLIRDGDTIQVGYGSIPNAIMKNLEEKKDLGCHTELVSDGLVNLMKKGVITNSRKSLNRGKTIASFCMGNRSTYDYIHDNPSLELRRIDYTNDPLIIARHDNMVAINSALQIDLTGQASAESIGKTFYSGIGGQADFMRGSVLAKGGRAILTLPSTAENGKVSRIVPFLSEGAGATLNRGDIYYVVTEYGIAYLHGRNIRERAMQLISIAHPKFRTWLIQEAKRDALIYKDQAFIPGKKGEYPEHLESWRTTSNRLELHLRPVKISDEPLLKDFFYDLSDESLYTRFMSTRRYIPHERLQEFCIIDYSREMVILAVKKDENEIEKIVGIGQYAIEENAHSAEVAFVVRDSFQNKGIGTELLKYLTYHARNQGLLGFTAEVLIENRSMTHVFEKIFPNLDKRIIEDIYQLRMQL